MQFYRDGFRGGNPDVKNAAPNRRDRSQNAPLPEKIDVLIVGTGPAGLCLAAQLAQFPEISTMIVEASPSNIVKGKADGINTRTMEMFQAFGFADKVKRETYWVNQTNFWQPDPDKPEHIKRIGRVQDVADDSSEMPHILINQARMHQLFLDVMESSPSRLRNLTTAKQIKSMAGIKVNAVPHWEMAGGGKAAIYPQSVISAKLPAVSQPMSRNTPRVRLEGRAWIMP